MKSTVGTTTDSNGGRPAFDALPSHRAWRFLIELFILRTLVLIWPTLMQQLTLHATGQVSNRSQLKSYALLPVFDWITAASDSKAALQIIVRRHDLPGRSRFIACLRDNIRWEPHLIINGHVPAGQQVHQSSANARLVIEGTFIKYTSLKSATDPQRHVATYEITHAEFQDSVSHINFQS